MDAQIKLKTVFFALLGQDYSKTWRAGAILRPDLYSTGKTTLAMTPIFCRTNSTCFFADLCYQSEMTGYVAKNKLLFSILPIKLLTYLDSEEND